MPMPTYPHPIPPEPKPMIKGLSQGTLPGAGSDFSISLIVNVENAMPNPTVQIDGTDVTVGAAIGGTGYGTVEALIPMAGLTVGTHDITVTDANGVSAPVQVFAGRL